LVKLEGVEKYLVSLVEVESEVLQSFDGGLDHAVESENGTLTLLFEGGWSLLLEPFDTGLEGGIWSWS
jgi:hypothetical protein